MQSALKTMIISEACSNQLPLLLSKHQPILTCVTLSSPVHTWLVIQLTPKGVIFSFLFPTRMCAACRAHQEGDHIRGHLQPDVPAAAQPALLLPPCRGPAHSPHCLPRYCLSSCPGSAFHNSQVLPFMMSRQCLSPFLCTAFHDVVVLLTIPIVFPSTAFHPAQSVPFTIPMYCLSTCCGPAHTPHRLPRYSLHPAQSVSFTIPMYCLSRCPGIPIVFPGTAFHHVQAMPFTTLHVPPFVAGGPFHNAHVLPFMMSRQCLSQSPCTPCHDVPAMPFTIPTYCLFRFPDKACHGSGTALSQSQCCLLLHWHLCPFTMPAATEQTTSKGAAQQLPSSAACSQLTAHTLVQTV